MGSMESVGRCVAAAEGLLCVYPGGSFAAYSLPIILCLLGIIAQVAGLVAQYYLLEWALDRRFGRRDVLVQRLSRLDALIERLGHHEARAHDSGAAPPLGAEALPPEAVSAPLPRPRPAGAGSSADEHSKTNEDESANT